MKSLLYWNLRTVSTSEKFQFEQIIRSLNSLAISQFFNLFEKSKQQTNIDQYSFLRWQIMTAFPDVVPSFNILIPSTWFFSILCMWISLQNLFPYDLEIYCFKALVKTKFHELSSCCRAKKNVCRWVRINLLTSQFSLCGNHKSNLAYLSSSESRSFVSDSLQPHGLYSPWNSPGQNTGVGSCSLLQGIFPTQGSYPGLPHCRRILYQLSHEGSP